MPVIRSRRDKDVKVNDGKAKLPFYQQNSYLGMCSQFTIPVTPAVSPNILTTGTQIYVDLEEFEVSTIDDFAFRFTIRAINDTKLAPIFYWFNEIEIRAEKGTGSVLQRIHSETMRQWMYFTQNQEEREHWARLGNYTIIRDPKTNRESIVVTDDNIIKAGEVRDIYLHLPSTFMQTSQIDMRHLMSELRFQLELSRDILLDGTTQADFELENIHMVIQSYQESASDTQTKLDGYKKSNHKYIYLDCERLTYNDRTIQSNSRQRFNLDQFMLKSPFMIFVWKPSSNPNVTDGSKYTYREIGDQGKIDLENSGGRSVYGNGNPPQAIEFFTKLIDQTGVYNQKGVYIMNWSEDIKQSLAGVINGYQQFDGSNWYLSFEIGEEAVSEVHRWSSFTTPGFNALANPMSNGGVGNLVVNNEINPIPLNIGNRIDYRNRFDESLLKYGITLNNTSGSDYDQVIDITYNPENGDVSSRIGLPTYINQVPATDSTDTALQVFNRPSVLTRGKDGWVSGSNYTLEIYCYKFKELLIHKNGRITCREL